MSGHAVDRRCLASQKISLILTGLAVAEQSCIFQLENFRFTFRTLLISHFQVIQTALGEKGLSSQVFLLWASGSWPLYAGCCATFDGS